MSDVLKRPSVAEILRKRGLATLDVDTSHAIVRAVVTVLRSMNHDLNADALNLAVSTLCEAGRRVDGVLFSPDAFRAVVEALDCQRFVDLMGDVEGLVTGAKDLRSSERLASGMHEEALADLREVRGTATRVQEGYEAQFAEIRAAVPEKLAESGFLIDDVRALVRDRGIAREDLREIEEFNADFLAQLRSIEKAVGAWLPVPYSRHDVVRTVERLASETEARVAENSRLRSERDRYRAAIVQIIGDVSPDDTPEGMGEELRLRFSGLSTELKRITEDRDRLGEICDRRDLDPVPDEPTQEVEAAKIEEAFEGYRVEMTASPDLKASPAVAHEGEGLRVEVPQGGTVTIEREPEPVKEGGQAVVNPVVERPPAVLHAIPPVPDDFPSRGKEPVRVSMREMAAGLTVTEAGAIVPKDGAPKWSAKGRAAKAWTLGITPDKALEVCRLTVQTPILTAVEVYRLAGVSASDGRAAQQLLGSQVIALRNRLPEDRERDLRRFYASWVERTKAVTNAS